MILFKRRQSGPKRRFLKKTEKIKKSGPRRQRRSNGQTMKIPICSGYFAVQSKLGARKISMCAPTILSM
jgi:hypothetical protein